MSHGLGKTLRTMRTTKVPNQSKKLLRIKAVTELTGLSKSYIYDLRNKGLFPKSIQLISGGSSVAWVEQEVLNWIESRIQERDEVA